MPRANRYILPRQFYHITHRCHDRAFLLRFAQDRSVYRNWLREGSNRYHVSILGYCITSNHIHLLTYSTKSESISRLMQFVEGRSAQDYNRRKKRKGAFWEDRYHCTIIDSGRYLWTCLAYIDLNMVRAGVISHPGKWEWCGFRELMGLRRRYRIIDLPLLIEKTGAETLAELQAHYLAVLNEYIREGRHTRDPEWTESLAV
ncbi:MAG: transposase, partial [Candidatus Auribacterota bacterium]|nr:transposase [Candidatus Auribacterota bacterium]